LKAPVARGELYQKLVSLHPPKGSPKFRVTDTRDGKGIIFVSRNGYVFPSGFLPYPFGNIRKESFLKIYKENPVLKKIRKAEFKGKCGVCPYRDVCGGSRSRAFAYTGDPLESDPACPYIPTEKNSQVNP